MKTRTSLRVVDAVIYLILLGSFFTSTQIHAHQLNDVPYHTAENIAQYEISCADFEKGIIDVLKEDIEMRQLFFTELSNHIMGNSALKVFDMQIAGDTKICYKSSPDLKKQNPSYTYFARLS